MGNLFWCNTVCCVFLLLQTRKNRGISPVFRLFAFDFRYHVRVSSSFLTPFASHRCAYGDTLDISMYNSFLSPSSRSWKDCSSVVQAYFVQRHGTYTEVIMENFAAILIPALLFCALVRLMALPIRWFWKLSINSACGFLCLWLLNSVATFTGLYFPVNAVTVIIAGFS